MVRDKLNTKELFASLDNAGSELLKLISSLNEKEINIIPFEDSWTAAQVAEHVTRSNNSIAKALKLQGETTKRNPAERAQELKTIFLDFTSKLKSPEFILPGQDIYKKKTLIAELKKSIDQLKEGSSEVNLSEAINHRAFGDITKLELLHFVVYHTQRHIHQLKNISKMVDNK